MLKPCGLHAQRAIASLEKSIDYFENEEPEFPWELGLKKAEMVREAIREIRAMTDKPELLTMDLQSAFLTNRDSRQFLTD